MKMFWQWLISLSQPHKSLVKACKDPSIGFVQAEVGGVPFGVEGMALHVQGVGFHPLHGRVRSGFLVPVSVMDER